MTMIKDEILANAIEIIQSRKQDVVRCTETGIPVSQIFYNSIYETIESYWLDNASLSAERLADEWELTHYQVNFRLSPMFQRTMIAQNRENRYARLAKSYEGRSRLFVYFLGRALFLQKRKDNGSLTWYVEKNRFVAACYDWTQSGEGESLVNETVLNLAILEGLTNVAAYIAQRRIRERIQSLLEALHAVGEGFEQAVESFITTLFDTLAKTDDEIQSVNSRVALPTAVALSQGAMLRQDAAAQRSRDMLATLQRKLTESYGSGKAITRRLTAEQAAKRLDPESVKADKADGRRGPRAGGFKKLSADAQAELMARFNHTFGSLFAEKKEESK